MRYLSLLYQNCPISPKWKMLNFPQELLAWAEMRPENVAQFLPQRRWSNKQKVLGDKEEIVMRFLKK